MVDHNLQSSVVEHPSLNKGYLRFNATIQGRGPILPAWGSREREKVLRQYWHHDYNTLFRGGIASIIKRVQSTPFTVRAPKEDGNRWQMVLMTADFGDWDRFLSKLITDYSRQDQGAFIELIAPGDPLKPPAGAVTGLAILDSVRCYPTGNPAYPVIYYDLNGKMHVLHQTRVIQFYDNPDSEENTPGYGDCALSRCIAPVKREILMGRYVETALDDEPPPGIAVFGNLGEEQIETAVQRMHESRSTDTPGEWGRMLRLYGLHAETKPTVDTFSFSKPPEQFAFQEYKIVDAHEIALGIGMDVQDIWGELSGSGLGTGRQSEVLSQKSRGKYFGRLLKGLERVFNRVFPVDVEMSWDYEDPQQDMEEAQILQTTAGSVQVLSSVLSVDEQRALLASTIPSVHDVLTDEDGNVIKLGDSDPKSDEQEVHEDVIAEAPAPVAVPDAMEKATKAFSDTAGSFATSFAAIAGNPAEGAVLRSLLRDQLWNSGLAAYEDGLRDGGVDPSDADAEELAQRRRLVAEWNAAQTPYIQSFADAILSGDISAPEQIASRVDLWVSKSLRAIYYAGLQDADEQINYEWQLGSTKEHCESCITLSGQVHKMKDYVKAGLLPGSSALACKGFECKCKLVRTTARTRGTLPGARPSFSDRLSSWLTNLLKGGR